MDVQVIIDARAQSEAALAVSDTLQLLGRARDPEPAIESHKRMAEFGSDACYCRLRLAEISSNMASYAAFGL